MAYDMDAEKMVKVLRIGREKLSDKGTASAVKRVDPVRSQTGLPREEVIKRMKETFMSLNGGVSSTITSEEYAAAESSWSRNSRPSSGCTTFPEHSVSLTIAKRVTCPCRHGIGRPQRDRLTFHILSQSSSVS